MTACAPTRAAGQRGMALVSSLLLLAVVTILALGMFRSFGVQEQIAGNLREKQRSLHAAETAQQHAEWWLTQGNNATTIPIACSGLLSANVGQGQICSNALTSVTSPPLRVGTVDTGVTYSPPGMTIDTTSARETYYKLPRFYIADVGLSADATGEIFQITAVGWGGNPSAVAVVQSTYSVKTGVVDRGGP